MYKKREALSRVIVIKPWRKMGNGAKGGGRKGNSGKMGIIYQMGESGKEPTELTRCTGPTFKDVTRQLRDTKLVPPHVTINSSGKTEY